MANYCAYLFERETKLSLDDYHKTRDKRFLKASSSFVGSLVVVYMSTSSLHLRSSSFESPKSVPPLLTRFGPVSSAVSSPSAVTVTNRPIARRSTPPSFFRREDRFPFARRNPYRQCRTLLRVANFYSFLSNQFHTSSTNRSWKNRRNVQENGKETVCSILNCLELFSKKQILSNAWYRRLVNFTFSFIDFVSRYVD